MRYLLLYIPFFVALLFWNRPEVSYSIAWVGSLYIFYITLTGRIKPIPSDLSFSEQFMRPLILTQIIFAGYMAVSSVFYFMDSIGFYYLNYNGLQAPAFKMNLIAECQRYYVLAHAAFVHGILWQMNYNQTSSFRIQIESISVFMLKLTGYFTAAALMMGFIPGFSQFQLKFTGLSFMASVIALAYALPERKTIPSLIAASLFLLNMMHALFSGWKEEMLVPVIVLGVFLFPHYKKLVIGVFPIILLIFFVFVPSYNGIVRSLSWSGNYSAKEAGKYAFEKIKSGEVEIAKTNWTFLTGRLSEISMFTQYVEGIPKLRPFYGNEIAEQALLSLIPRKFYPEKPVTEKLVMERVIAAGVVEAHSSVSAKPPLVTDAYLSGGGLAIFLVLFITGALASWISVTAERIFGGYLIGSGLIFSGLFQIFWRGNCFEFMLNTIFWSLILMFILFLAGRNLKILVNND